MRPFLNPGVFRSSREDDGSIIRGVLWSNGIRSLSSWEGGMPKVELKGREEAQAQVKPGDEVEGSWHYWPGDR